MPPHGLLNRNGSSRKRLWQTTMLQVRIFHRILQNGWVLSPTGPDSTIRVSVAGATKGRGLYAVEKYALRLWGDHTQWPACCVRLHVGVGGNVRPLHLCYSSFVNFSLIGSLTTANAGALLHRVCDALAVVKGAVSNYTTKCSLCANVGSTGRQRCYPSLQDPVCGKRSRSKVGPNIWRAESVPARPMRVRSNTRDSNTGFKTPNPR
jgi:hypothetical protein